MNELIFATGNFAKLAQLVFVIEYRKAPFVAINARQRYGDAAAYKEVGRTPAAIVEQGALTVAERINVPVMTEDTSLYVDALDDQPGLKAGVYLNDNGRAGILKALNGQQNRAARITSAVAWATPQGDVQSWVRHVHGMITKQELWDETLPDWIAPTSDNPMGGGYNAIFVPEGSDKSLAQIPPVSAMLWGYREPNFLALLEFLLMRM